jgi:phage terminase large subunit-like protein
LIHLAEQYISDVLGGKIVVGKKARQAVDRHLDDLAHAKERGWRLNETEAEIALTFISCLRHTKGAYSRVPFRLQPFQAFIIYVIFGWQIRNDDGQWVRRFRKAYVRMARKNGKSELAAAIGLYMVIADGEAGAEVYTAATIRNQALKVFEPAAAMMKMLKQEDPEIGKTVKVFTSKNNALIKFDDGAIQCIMEPISMDADTSEGSSPHGAIIDEYHQHKTTKAVDVFESGTGGRLQPLLFIITTAGFDVSLPCYQLELTYLKVLSGEVKLDRVFVMVFDLDDEDDWKDETVWEKASPGVRAGFPTIEGLRDECQKAQVEGYSSEKRFRVKNCNQWLSQSVGWINEDDWNSSQTDFTLEEMRGRRCIMGLDLASVNDTASLCLMFPPENRDEKFRFWWKTWCHEQQVENPKRNEGKIVYKKWAKEGYITAVDGNTLDFEAIKMDILDLAKMFEVGALGYDRAFGYYIIPDLNKEGINCCPISQRAMSLTVPIYQIENLAKGGFMEIHRNPLVSWQMGNVVMVYEDGDNVRISKRKSPEKIDCIAAMIDAVRAYIDDYGEEEAVTIFDLMQARLLVK